MNYENTFTHDGKVYDLAKLQRLVRSTPMKLVPIKDLLWVLKYDTPSEDRVALAKHRYPLLVARSHSGKMTVIDGLHRLEKYRRKGVFTVPIKEVSPEILERCLVHR